MPYKNYIDYKKHYLSYGKAHRMQQRLTSAQWRAKHPRYMKKYRKVYYKQNQQFVDDKNVHYYLRHKETILNYKKDWYRKHKIKTNNSSLISRLRNSYGLSIQDYKSMIQNQQGKCLICKGIPKDTLHVDHCHKTKVVRGLLCRSCNNGLGLFKDDTLLLQTAINYLKGAINEG